MGAFSQVEARQPPAIVLVPPNGFADTWDERPETQVAMGLRLIADSDLEDARIEAFKRAQRLIPNHQQSSEATQLWIASFQGALIRWIIARGTCDANDIQKPWEGWEAAPEDIVPDALHDRGAQHIFDAWERMRLAIDIGIPEASDEDLSKLTELLLRLPRLALQDRARAGRIRRLMRFVLEELEDMGPEMPAEPAAAEEPTGAASEP